MFSFIMLFFHIFSILHFYSIFTIFLEIEYFSLIKTNFVKGFLKKGGKRSNFYINKFNISEFDIKIAKGNLFELINYIIAFNHY